MTTAADTSEHRRSPTRTDAAMTTTGDSVQTTGDSVQTGRKDPLHSGAIFRIANPELLRSPLPYHVLLKNNHHQHAANTATANAAAPQTSTPSFGFGQNPFAAGLARPKPVYAQLNPSHDLPSTSTSTTPTTTTTPSGNAEFKMPSLPASLIRRPPASSAPMQRPPSSSPQPPPPASPSNVQSIASTSSLAIQSALQTTVADTDDQDTFDIGEYIHMDDDTERNDSASPSNTDTPKQIMTGSRTSNVHVAMDDDNEPIDWLDREIQGIVDEVHESVLSQHHEKSTKNDHVNDNRNESDTEKDSCKIDKVQDKKSESDVEKKSKKISKSDKETKPAAVDKEQVVGEKKKRGRPKGSTNVPKTMLSSKSLESNKMLQKPTVKKGSIEDDNDSSDEKWDEKRSAVMKREIKKKYKNADVVFFEPWWIARVQVAGNASNNISIIIQGYKLVENGDPINWHSSLITKREENRVVKTASGRLYTLLGPIDERMMKNHEFSEKIIRAFKNGFPSNWQDILASDDSGSPKKHKSNDNPPPQPAKSTKTAKKSAEHDQEESNASDSDAEPAAPAKLNRLKQRRSDSEDTSVSTEPTTRISMPSKSSIKPTAPRRRETIAASTTRTVPPSTSAATPTTTADDSRPTRSGRLSLPPRDYWKADSSTPTTRSSRRTGSEIKFEWGTGKVRVLEETREVRVNVVNGKTSVVDRKRKVEKEEVESESDDDEDGEQQVEVSEHSEAEEGKSESEEEEQEQDEEKEKDCFSSVRELPWNEKEDRILERAMCDIDPRDKKFWQKVADELPHRTPEECESRYKLKDAKVMKKSKPFKNHRDAENVGVVGKKGTVARRKQIQSIIQQRQDEHEGDDLFSSATKRRMDDSDGETRKKVKPMNLAVQRTKRPVFTPSPTQSTTESPGVLKKVEPKDTYIRQLKKTLNHKGLTRTKPVEKIKKRNVKHDKEAEDVLRGKKKLDSEREADSDEEYERDEEERGEEAMDYYALSESDE